MSVDATDNPGAIIPPEAAPLRALTVTMTVMCYLACLAIGALILINQAVNTWTSGLSREVTVQIRQLQDVDIEGEISAAMTLLTDVPGITNSEVVDKQAAAKLLEPWLGTAELDDLPIPRLIRVTIDEQSPPDFTRLEEQLTATVKGASLDTHRRWQAELTRMATALSTLSLAILALICVSTVAMVIFATRTVLDANRQVVDVLHLIGAKDGYIARQIDRRFLTTGLLAGLLGVAIGILTFLLLSFTGTAGAGGVADAARGLLFGTQNTLWNYLAFLAVPAIATFISLITSRVALMRMLGNVL